MKRIYDVGQFLFDSGLDFKINVVALHPLGLSLEIERDQVTGKAVITSILDHRDEPGGLVFTADEYRAGQEKLGAYAKENHLREKINERLLATGFIVQPPPGRIVVDVEAELVSRGATGPR
jgi:hypothetical protein